jgi:hypothetical protein
MSARSHQTICHANNKATMAKPQTNGPVGDSAEGRPLHLLAHSSHSGATAARSQRMLSNRISILLCLLYFLVFAAVSALCSPGVRTINGNEDDPIAWLCPRGGFIRLVGGSSSGGRGRHLRREHRSGAGYPPLNEGTVRRPAWGLVTRTDRPKGGACSANGTCNCGSWMRLSCNHKLGTHQLMPSRKFI